MILKSEEERKKEDDGYLVRVLIVVVAIMVFCNIFLQVWNGWFRPSPPDVYAEIKKSLEVTPKMVREEVRDLLEVKPAEVLREVGELRAEVRQLKQQIDTLTQKEG